MNHFDHDSVQCSSYLATDASRYCVRITYSAGRVDVFISPEKARGEGLALLDAVGAMDSDELLFQACQDFNTSLRVKPPGFMALDQKQRSPKKRPKLDDKNNGVAIFHAVRGKRPKLSDSIDIIYGEAAQEPLANWTPPGQQQGEKRQIQVDRLEAKSIGLQLIEAAESADTDSFMLKFFQERFQGEEGINALAIASGILQEFKNFRDRSTLESMFKVSTGQNPSTKNGPD